MTLKPAKYTKLHFNSVNFDGVDAPFGPNLICQACGAHFNDDKDIPTTSSVVKDSQKRSFTCPKCKATIELYVAVARTDKGEQNIQISVNSIDPDWLEKDIAERVIEETIG